MTRAFCGPPPSDSTTRCNASSSCFSATRCHVGSLAVIFAFLGGVLLDRLVKTEEASNLLPLVSVAARALKTALSPPLKWYPVAAGMACVAQGWLFHTLNIFNPLRFPRAFAPPSPPVV